MENAIPNANSTRFPLVTISNVSRDDVPAKLSVMLIESRPVDAEVVRITLASIEGHPFDLRVTTQLFSALEHLRAGGVHLILLNLELPDSRGLATLDTLQTVAPDLPMVVLTEKAGEQLGIDALQHGAQDYLVKSKISGEVLVRALRYAFERKYLASALEKSRRDKQRQWYSVKVAECYQCHLLKTRVEQVPHCKGCDTPEDQEFLLASYRELIYRSIGQLRTGDFDTKESAQKMADLLAAQGCGASEIAKIHQRVLKEYGKNALPTAERVFAVDARLVLINVLGRLLDLYRDWAMHFVDTGEPD